MGLRAVLAALVLLALVAVAILVTQGGKNEEEAGARGSRSGLVRQTVSFGTIPSILAPVCYGREKEPSLRHLSLHSRTHH